MLTVFTCFSSEFPSRSALRPEELHDCPRDGVRRSLRTHCSHADETQHVGSGLCQQLLFLYITCCVRWLMSSSFAFQYFHKVAGQLLPLAYNLLKRNLFAEIIEAHLADRSREDVDQLAA